LQVKTMVLPICKLPPPVESVDVGHRVEWDEYTNTRLADIARKRGEALRTLSQAYESVDPVAQKAARVAQEAQQYWETMVFETGHLAVLSPQKSSNASAWLASWLGAKVGVAGQIREPLLNIKRQADGMMREAAVYTMMGKQRELAELLQAEAKKVGDTVHPEDMRRLLEEGMIPQRMSVYKNTTQQENALMGSYNNFIQSLTDRGYSQDAITGMLTKASDVSSQLDSFLAVQQATGLDVGTMYNLGMMPRQMTDDGFAQARLAGGVKLTSEHAAMIAVNKSRSTWKYLADDHTLTAQLLGISEADLHGLIANPGDFAQYLSKRTTPEQLDKLVDSGIMSKIPMLTSDVNEYMTRKYGLPFGTTDLFIADPLQATKVTADKLRVLTERSAMVKLVETEGLKVGWAIPATMQYTPGFEKFVPLSSIHELKNIVGDSFVHPIVASQLKAIISVSKQPSELGKAARIYKTFTSLFARQALGNPLTAHAYLTGQFLGNMISSYGGGASLLQYGTSVQDVLKLAFKGLDEFDTTPKYIIDGVEHSERDLVAKTMRMFSHEILPGITGNDRLFKFDYFNPVRISEQVGKLRAASDSMPELASELTHMAGRAHDSVMSPTLRMAALLDTASHLALVRQHARRTNGGGGSFLLSGVDAGVMDTWEQLSQHVLRHVPVFDDMGKVQTAISRIFPFTGWAMQNLPLQLADMVRNPSKWYNYARVHALWNDAVIDDNDPILKGEMSPSDAGKYGIVLRRDSGNKGTVMLQTDQYDGKWGALGWLMNSLKGGEADPLTRTKTNPIATAFNQALSKSYFAGMYKAVSGIDPYTGFKSDPSDYNGTNQFMGMTMPPWMQNVLSISPVLTSVDRLPLISGTRAVIDPRTGQELIPAVRNWLGGVGELPPSRLTAVEQTVQILGGRVRYIDGIQNMRYTERDTERAIDLLTKKILAEQVNLADDVKKGAIASDSPSYKARLENIHKMADAAIQINFDLARIQIWGIKNQIPTGKQMLEFKQRGLVLDNLPLPGGEYINRALEDAYKLKHGAR
jgi:hypothetical protein